MDRSACRLELPCFVSERNSRDDANPVLVLTLSMKAPSHAPGKVSETILVFSIVVLAVVMSLSVTAITGRFSDPERWEYSDIALNLFQGRGAFYQYTGTKYYFYGPPAYPILLAGAMWIGDRHEMIILIFQSVLFALTCGIIYLTARSIFGTTEALIAGLLGALHPGALIYAGKLHSQALDVFLIVLSFLLLLRTNPGWTVTKGFVSGLVAGLAILSRGTVAPFLALWSLWFLSRHSTQWKDSLRVVISVVLGVFLVIAPILVRGYLIYGEIIPLRTDTGINLWSGNHPGATGTAYILSNPPSPAGTKFSQEDLKKLAAMNEIEQNRAFVGAVLHFIQNHPSEFLTLLAKKLYYFWWFSPHSGLQYPSSWLISYKVYYGVLLLFAIGGLMVSIGAPGGSSIRAGASLFLLAVLSISMTQSLFYVEGRHRWQIEPLLLVFSAFGILCLLRGLASYSLMPLWVRRKITPIV